MHIESNAISPMMEKSYRQVPLMGISISIDTGTGFF